MIRSIKDIKQTLTKAINKKREKPTRLNHFITDEKKINGYSQPIICDWAERTPIEKQAYEHVYPLFRTCTPVQMGLSFTVDCLQIGGVLPGKTDPCFDQNGTVFQWDAEEIDNLLNFIGGVLPGKIDQRLDEVLLTAMTGDMFDQNGTVFPWNKGSYTIKVDYHQSQNHPQNFVPDPNAPVGSPELKAWDDVKGLTLDKIWQARCRLWGRNMHSQHILASPLWHPLPIAYGMPFFYSYLQYVPFFHPEEYNIDGRKVEKIYVFAPDQFVLGYKEQKNKMKWEVSVTEQSGYELRITISGEFAYVRKNDNAVVIIEVDPY